MTIEIRIVRNEDRTWVRALLCERWGGTRIVTRGCVHEADALFGILALQRGKPKGLLTYHVAGDACEIVTLDSLDEGKGIGTALIQAVRETALSEQWQRIWLVTTNDNTHALRFYQKRGLRLVTVHLDAVRISRQLKPEIPVKGIDGIPITDEIELELSCDEIGNVPDLFRNFYRRLPLLC